jgi:hemolysin III
MDVLDLREPVSAWSHGIGLLLAIPGTLLLWWRSRGEPGKQWSLLVYGLSLAFCYAASTLYHGVRLPADRVAAFARLDSVGIFTLIAGSYTALAWNLMRGRWRRWTLVVVWTVTAASAALGATGRKFPPVLATCVYLGLGWGIVACYREIARVVSRRDLLPIAAGGVSYSVGAVLNLLGWPVLWPEVFGAHELFHLFVMAGSLAHYGFALAVIVPFVWEPADLSRVPGPRVEESALAREIPARSS